MKRRQDHLALFKFKTPQVCNHHRWPLSEHAESSSRQCSIDKTRRRDEVYSLGKAALAVGRNHQHAFGQNRNLTSTTAARQTDEWFLVISDYSRVQITKPINLGALQEANIDESAL